MAFTRSGVRSPSPPLAPSAEHDPALLGRCAAAGRALKSSPLRGNSSVGRAQPCQGWGRGFESRFPLVQGVHAPGLVEYRTKPWRTEGIVAGWSSLVARRAHNPEVVGSNPTPATWSERRRVGGTEKGSHRESSRTRSTPPPLRLSAFSIREAGRLAQLVRAPR
jgi:hypothetical protein